MIWQNPWAWLGLATIALPVIIHLLGRGHARVHRFPTLRFIDASRLLPTRRTRLSDLVILAVRASALIAAAAALAQPLIVTARRSTAANAALARVVIVDTSANATANGRAALDSVRRASPLAREVTIATVIPTGDPSGAIPGAAAWLERQPTRGEIAIISRFQRGALDSADVASIAPRLGIRLVRAPSNPPGPVERRTRAARDETVARVAASGERTDVEWSARSTTMSRDVAPVIFASPTERPRADAALAAAGTVPVALPVDSISPIGVVEPGYAERATILANSTRPRRAWMMDIVAKVAADSTFVEAARRATIVSTLDDTSTVVVARTDSGRPVVLAAENTADGRERLLFLSLADAGSLTSAALIAGIRHASSVAPPAQWLDPSTIPDAQLARWQRAPTVESFPRRTSGDGATDGESDGRWFWLIALVLLAFETWLRRERRATIHNEIAHERAA
jgi:Aerotolerance regulator N-terminal